MGTKNNPGKYDCYCNALPDEEMFILLARDPSAPAIVEAWADHREKEIRRGRKPESDMPIVIEARECAERMRRWRDRNMGKWRKTDG